MARQQPRCGAAAERAQAVLRLGKQAQGALRRGELRRARGMAERLLALPGTDVVWGLGLLETILQRQEQRESDPATRARLALERRRVRERSLEQLAGAEAWLHRWERARQLNNHAWEMLCHGGDLEDALREVEASLVFYPYLLPHQGTRIDILLALGRDDEGYRAGRWVAAVQPDWPDVTDVIASDAYKTWLASHAREPLDLPDRQVTAGPVLPRLRGRPSPARAPLRPDERALLRRVRFGHDEWHRARNCALLAVLLDGGVPLDRLLALPTHAADLTLGVVQDVGGRSWRLKPPVLRALRHWMLYGFTNHTGHHAGTPPGMRERLFVDWELRPMTMGSIERELGQIGEAIGLKGLRTARF